MKISGEKLPQIKLPHYYVIAKIRGNIEIAILKIISYTDDVVVDIEYAMSLYLILVVGIVFDNHECVNLYDFYLIIYKMQLLFYHSFYICVFLDTYSYFVNLYFNFLGPSVHTRAFKNQ